MVHRIFHLLLKRLTDRGKGNSGMEGGLTITQALIAEYLQARQSEGLAEQTIANYRRKLRLLYELLPPDKTIRAGTLTETADRMETKGYSTQTVNIFLAVVDGLLAWCGRYDLQAHFRHKTEKAAQPELTREEYLRLLSAAKTLNKPKAYYFIKTIAILGVNTQKLRLVTVEAAQNGFFRCGDGLVRIPASFAGELLRFAKSQGIHAGPLFLSRAGSPVTRSTVNAIIASVQQDAQVAPEKCNPSSLRKLCLSTQETLQARMQRMHDQEYDRLLAQEDAVTGWNIAREAEAVGAFEPGREHAAVR